MNINDVLIKPIITEKTYMQSTENVYVFEVNKRATKEEIKTAIELVFRKNGVKVDRINTLNVKSKPKNLGSSMGRSRSYRKAYIYLKEGNIPLLRSIDEANEEKAKKRSILDQTR